MFKMFKFLKCLPGYRLGFMEMWGKLGIYKDGKSPSDLISQERAGVV